MGVDCNKSQGKGFFLRLNPQEERESDNEQKAETKHAFGNLRYFIVFGGL